MRIKILIISFIILLICIDGNSQVTPDPCGVGETCAGICDSFGCNSTECNDCLASTQGIPIDGGLIWLILGGGGLGLRRLIKNKKEEKVK